MSTTDAVIESEVLQGWPALFKALPTSEPTVYYSLVSPANIIEARDSIRLVIRDLTRLSRSINAWAGDDDFDQMNAADMAIEELALALEKLGGRS